MLGLFGARGIVPLLPPRYATSLDRPAVAAHMTLVIRSLPHKFYEAVYLQFITELCSGAEYGSNSASAVCAHGCFSTTYVCARVLSSICVLVISAVSVKVLLCCVRF